MTVPVTPADLGVYLGISMSADEQARAQMLIDDAVTQALSIVTVGTVPDTGPTVGNLPVGAESVIRPAVARIYLNPRGVDGETAGPINYSSRGGGTGSLYSKAEVRALRRLAGRSGAFTIDTLPADAGTNLPPWDSDTWNSSFTP